MSKIISWLRSWRLVRTANCDHSYCDGLAVCEFKDDGPCTCTYICGVMICVSECKCWHNTIGLVPVLPFSKLEGRSYDYDLKDLVASTQLERGVLDRVLNPPPDEPHIALAKAAMKAGVVPKGTRLNYTRENISEPTDSSA